MCNIYWAVKRFLLLFMWHEINFVSFTLITNTFIISFTSAFILIAQKNYKASTTIENSPLANAPEETNQQSEGSNTGISKIRFYSHQAISSASYRQEEWMGQKDQRHVINHFTQKINFLPGCVRFRACLIPKPGLQWLSFIHLIFTSSFHYDDKCSAT